VDETPREKWAGYLGLFFTIVPGLIVSGFMPEWDVLPFHVWLGIATAGAAVAGAIATPRTLRGAISGAVAGAGVMLGIFAYVALRAGITGNHTFLKLEILIGVLIGCVPGVLLYLKWARAEPA